MSYLLCYAYDHEYREVKVSPSYGYPIDTPVTQSIMPVVKLEEFDSFREAIEQYTYRCLVCGSVTLSIIGDNGEGKIIRQYCQGESSLG